LGFWASVQAERGRPQPDRQALVSADGMCCCACVGYQGSKFQSNEILSSVIPNSEVLIPALKQVPQ
jgi:hypothetical protein